MLASQANGFDCASLEFALNIQSYRQGHRRHHLDHQVCGCYIDDFARNRLADFSAAANRCLLTDIDWDHAAMLLMITHAHTLATQAAQHATLEQSGSFTRGPCSPFTSECPGVFREPTLIGFKALPVDIARVHAGHDELPVGPGHLDNPRAAGWHVARACTAIREGSRVSWIVQHLQNTRVLWWRPQDVTFVQPDA